MKRYFIFVLVFFVLTGLSSAASKSSMDETFKQVLVPKEVYVGDTAQILCSFRSAADFFALADSSQINGDVLILDNNFDAFKSLEGKCHVQSVYLSRNDMSYTFTVNIIPWEPGYIDFEPFDLVELCSFNNKENINSQAQYIIDIDSIQIASIAERLNVTNLKPVHSPLILPGTNYVLWIFIILAIFLFICLLIVLIKFQTVLMYLKQIKKNYGYFINAWKTLRRLNGLLKKKNSDKEFALLWQKYIRDYFSFKYNYNFNSVLTKNIYSEIEKLTAGLLKLESCLTIERLCKLFIRTDYIRYASGSIDSRQLPVSEHEAVFAADERLLIIKETKECITVLESKNKKDNEND